MKIIFSEALHFKLVEYHLVDVDTLKTDVHLLMHCNTYMIERLQYYFYILSEIILKGIDENSATIKLELYM